MKLFFKTANPAALKTEILKLIEDNKLQTWMIHTSGNVKYLKHTQQWGDKGVIKLTADTTKMALTSEVLRFQNIQTEVKDFEGYYLGRFCEIIFVNFSGRFTSIDKG